MEALSQLADFITNLTFESIPEVVVKRAKWVLRDTIGVIVGGMAEPELSQLAEYAIRTAPGQAHLLAHSGRVSPTWAALVHGTAGTTLEMDEGHAFARGHAAIHAVPPALALAQTRQAGGQALLTAIVAGYEVAARAGIASRLRPPVHPFGAWGVLGAAAVGAWFKGFSADEIAGTLELAASYAITPSFETAYQGANVRNTYAGIVNHLGLLAADFYELGFRGEEGGLQTAFGEILGQAFDPAALNDGLGQRYEIMRGYFKPYSGCRYTHAAIDAILGLQEEGTVEIESLAAVEVATYDIAAHLADPAPKTPLAGRFSTPYVAAATLVNGSAGPEIFTSSMLTDPLVLDLAARISVSEDADFTAMTPARRPARVTLHFRDGRQREKTVYGSKGDPGQPMSAAELEAKFHRLCEPAIGTARAQQAWNELGQVDRRTNLDELMNYLVTL
ncbi:MAG TPA: MmgE/PrpD family protein [Anaerolineae bacterium]|jgi:2-methylcitrate dehydratase PrpD|nr:MmgE/PrpD family protein [Anaerolineae bacterium]